MASGKTSDQRDDPLTVWGKAAIKILLEVDPSEVPDNNTMGTNMLNLIKKLDMGKLDSYLSEPGFMEQTEILLLAVLQGKQIEISDPKIYAFWKEIFAAAQVIYNHAVARGLWILNPEIKSMMKDQN